MTKFTTKVYAVVVMFAVAMMSFAYAQSITGKSVKVAVDGTSPMHDWTMSGSNGTFAGTVSGNTIKNVKFTFPAKNLKSTKGKMMDNKAYGALKADKNPTASFTATSMNIGKGNVTGKMTIGGVSKNVTFPVTVAKSGSSYNVAGTYSMKLSDYGMERPGFMGVRTGDAVTVKVNITAN